MTAEEILNIARKEIGTKESPSGSNRVKYNTWYYNKEVRGAAYPWCCAFICWLFKDTNLVLRTASCSEMVVWFKKQKRFYSDPKVGDLVFFNFSHPDKLADHVGIVDSVVKNGVYAIEGNTSVTSNDNGGSVMRRLRKAKIIGYGRPNYSNTIKGKKSNEEIALEVLAGEWGNGPERKKRITEAGYDYSIIQKLVNNALKK